jgi:hypothetical protein
MPSESSFLLWYVFRSSHTHKETVIDFTSIKRNPFSKIKSAPARQLVASGIAETKSQGCMCSSHPQHLIHRKKGGKQCVLTLKISENNMNHHERRTQATHPISFKHFFRNTATISRPEYTDINMHK